MKMVFRHTQGGEGGGGRACVTFVTKKMVFFLKASLSRIGLTASRYVSVYKPLLL